MAKYILSVDQGTTGSTVSLITMSGRQKAKSNQEFPQIFPKPGWVEHNPNDIWKSVLGALKKTMAKAKARGEDIEAIGITNQRETVVAWDRKTGQAVGNAIVWQCRRTTDLCLQFKKKGHEKNVQKTTGLVLDPYFSATKMLWMLKNRPGVKKLARQGRLCFGTIDSFLIWKFSNGKSFSTDVSNASRTLCMGLKSLDYNDDLLKLFKLKREMLPRIRPSAGEFGVTSNVPGLSDGIPISGAIGDQQSALFGQFCFSKGSAKITYGTGSFLLMNTGPKIVQSKKGLLSTVAWQLSGQSPNYALEGGAFICGAGVQWLRDNLGIIESSSQIEKLARSVSDNGGVSFVPAFAGLGAPYWNPNVRGTLLGLTRGTKQAHLARALLEALSMQNVDIVNTMKKEAGIRLNQVRVDGGACSNNLLMGLQANDLGVLVQRPKNIESTSMGAAFMAGFGVGLWSSPKDLQKLDRIDREFNPTDSSRVRNKRVEYWQKTIKNIQKLY